MLGWELKGKKLIVILLFDIEGVRGWLMLVVKLDIFVWIIDLIEFIDLFVRDVKMKVKVFFCWVFEKFI